MQSKSDADYSPNPISAGIVKSVVDSLVEVNKWMEMSQAVSSSMMKALGGEMQLDGQWVLRALINERDINNVTSERPGLLAVLEKATCVFDTLCQISNFQIDTDCLNDRFKAEIGSCSLFKALLADEDCNFDYEHCGQWLGCLIGEPQVRCCVKCRILCVCALLRMVRVWQQKVSRHN